MRPTIRLDDQLLKEAKQLAAQSGRSLTSVIEDALREIREQPNCVLVAPRTRHWGIFVTYAKPREQRETWSRLPSWQRWQSSLEVNGLLPTGTTAAFLDLDGSIL